MKTLLLALTLLTSSAVLASYDSRDEESFERTTHSITCKDDQRKNVMSFFNSSTEHFDYYDRDRSSNEYNFALELGVLKLRGNEKVAVKNELVPFTNPVTGRDSKVLKLNYNIEKDGARVEITLFNDGLSNKHKTVHSVFKSNDLIDVFGTVTVFAGELLVSETELNCSFEYQFEYY